MCFPDSSLPRENNSIERLDSKKSSEECIGLKKKVHSRDKRVGCLETRSIPVIRVRVGIYVFS